MICQVFFYPTPHGSGVLTDFFAGLTTLIMNDSNNSNVNSNKCSMNNIWYSYLSSEGTRARALQIEILTRS